MLLRSIAALVAAVFVSLLVAPLLAVSLVALVLSLVSARVARVGRAVVCGHITLLGLLLLRSMTGIARSSSQLCLCNIREGIAAAFKGAYELRR